MGSIGNFLFGGSTQKQSSDQSSSSNSSSQNQSQNSSVQGSTNDSVNGNASASNSNGYNLSYGPVAASMTPTLGYTQAGGNLLGALLGVPGYSATGGPAPADPTPYAYTPPAPVGLPSTPTPTGGGSSDTLTSLINTLTGSSPAATPQHTQAEPNPTPVDASPAGIHVPVLSYLSAPSGGGYGEGKGAARTGLGDVTYGASKADGGPIPAAQPTLVGEKGPEVFVPHTAGTVVPNPASSPQSDAMNNYFNSAGGQFLMNQGQNAVNSDASARGTLQSGATGVALQKMGTGLASTYMNDYINHLLDFSKLGLGGASAMTGAGNVNNSNSVSSGFGNSNSASYGNSQGTSSGSSTGLSTSTGTSSGSGNSKKGLVPDILG